MDGFECCQRLKDAAATLHIPVVMVTALGEPGERLRGLEAGADDFLTKPVEYDTLMARGRSLVRLKRLLDEWRGRGETARALVVDDWDLGAEAIEAALRHEGIAAARAHSGAEALRLTAAAPYDLVIV